MIDIKYETYTRNPYTGAEWTLAEFEAFDWNNYLLKLKTEHEFAIAKASKEREMFLKYENRDIRQVIASSVGFDIDANRDAKDNVASLIKHMKINAMSSEFFRGADNEFYEVTVAQLETIEAEIIAAGLAYYKAKWGTEQEIANAKTTAEIEAVVV